jgi:hypothetical protein
MDPTLPSLPSPPSPPPDPAVLLAELETSLDDAIRRASSRAEHMRLVRMQALVYALYGRPGEPAA